MSNELIGAELDAAVADADGVYWWNKSIPRNNSSGYLGVTRSRGRDRWEAYGREGEKRIYLGLYDTPELAYVAAKSFRDERGYSESHGTKT